MAKSKLENKNPPRRTTIRGQDHLLAYITPEEAQLLMDNGGTGEAGPMGIPSFVKAGAGAGGPAGMGSKSMEGFGGGKGPDKDNEKGAVDPGLAKAVAEKAAELAAAKGPVGGGLTPGQSQAMFSTPAYAGLGTEQAISAAKAAGNQFAGGVEKARAIDIASLQTLNKQLEDLSRREALAKSRLYSPMSLIPGFGLANYFGLQNVRNLAASAIGAPPGLLGGLGLGERVSPDFGGLGVSGLIGLQSQAVTDDMGNIVGFRDEYGNLKYGGDPNAGPQGDGRDVVPAQMNPVTGQQNQCPDGYVFDEDLQACRVSAGLPGGFGTVPDTGPYQPGTYARMGLLDVAPTGLEQFASTYGTGFGTAPDYEAANLRYRKQAGTTPQIFQDPYNLPGYTLLS